ncbi:sigmaC [Reptilian orthoreovirus]|uniref:SigmaC n=1 Tax=chelonian orthoreovirus TaxID=3071237 RepID=A0A1D7PVH8_9REOV|nr:sigmaC [Reptilian orthoreovirus]AOM63691.1 sigmaC [chelonian orthoreovirus]
MRLSPLQRSDVIKLIISLSGAGGGGADLGEIFRRLELLEKSDATLVIRVSGLESSVQVLTQDVNGLTTGLQIVQGQVSVLDTRVTDAEERITQNTTRITQHDAIISQNTRDIDTLRNSLADLSTLVVTEKNRLDTVVRDVTSHSLSITDLQTRVTALEQGSSASSYEWPLSKDSTTGHVELKWDPWFLETTQIFGLSWSSAGIKVGDTLGDVAWYGGDGTLIYSVSATFEFFRWGALGAFTIATNNALLNKDGVELRIPYTTDGTGLMGTDLDNMTPSTVARMPSSYPVILGISGTESTYPVTVSVQVINNVTNIILKPQGIKAAGGSSYPCYIKSGTYMQYVRLRQMT